jgi:hypothetical protein
MKRNSIKIMLTAGLIGLSISSCKKNLILTPNDEVTQAQVFSTPAGITQAMAKVYGSFALTGNDGGSGAPDIQGIDEGTSDFFREYWDMQDLTTDEPVYTWNDPGIYDMQNDVWSATNVNVEGLYDRSLYQITLVNNFLQQTTATNMSKYGISGANLTTINYFRAEARFLRAYQYWVLMDVYGNPPFVTENTVLGSGYPPQISRKALYAYVVSELKAIDPLMVKPLQNQYGRADEGAVWALLARVYLNAGVYTGTPDYTDAITYASKVIGAGYTLVPHFTQLFLADNHLCAGVQGGGIASESEFIFTINYNGVHTQGYGGLQYLTHGGGVGSMPSDSLGIGSGYDELRAKQNIPNLFPTPPYTDGTHWPNNGNADTRAEFWYPGQQLDVASQPTEADGLGVTKFRDVTRTGGQGNSETYSDIDLPVFRLPEMYLIYAESVLQGGSGGSAAQALTYINDIRTRAYGGSTAGNITSGGLTLQFILDERGREFFWEGFRRTDLIRINGQFISSSYGWPFKGGVASGTGLPSYRNLMPIPESDLSANPNLKQNTGY